MSTYFLAHANDVSFLIEENEEGIFLHSIKPGVHTGDTWYPSLEEAKAQAAYNARQIVGPWEAITGELGDKLKRGEASK